jgi:4Fe-4S ferredoxin
MDSIELAKAILELSPKDFILITKVLFGDYKEIRQIVTIFNMNHYDPQINDGCIGCGLCVDLCEVKSISLDSLKAKINPRYCCGCLMCVEGCPTKSIEILEVKNG